MNNNNTILVVKEMMRRETPAKPWSVAQFEEFRPHMTNFVREKIVG